MNKKGSAMLLALVLTMAVLPAAGTLANITRSDLAAALDDYHHTKAAYAARGAIALVEADLLNGGDGQVTWPDPDVSLDISVTETEESWNVITTTYSDRAVFEIEVEITGPGEEKMPAEIQ